MTSKSAGIEAGSQYIEYKEVLFLYPSKRLDVPGKAFE